MARLWQCKHRQHLGEPFKRKIMYLILYRGKTATWCNLGAALRRNDRSSGMISSGSQMMSCVNLSGLIPLFVWATGPHTRSRMRRLSSGWFVTHKQIDHTWMSVAHCTHLEANICSSEFPAEAQTATRGIFQTATEKLNYIRSAWFVKTEFGVVFKENITLTSDCYIRCTKKRAL